MRRPSFEAEMWALGVSLVGVVAVLLLSRFVCVGMQGA